ncbi:MAG: leucine-rich repeat domain-containing protein, partial [Clostridia bacterium]|nr:leucine-rich repeat domain-containing protein [Clostridia bacterium]
TQNQFSLDLTTLDKKTEYTDSNHTHEYAGDCDTICELCLKETRTVTVNHTYYNDCDSTCNVCNTARNTDHSYTNDCDATCNNNCGTVRTPPHYYENSSCSACEFPTYQDFRYNIIDNEVTVTKYIGKAATVSIPETINNLPVVYIGEYCFNSNRTITSVTIPATIKNVGIYSFYDCSKLTTVNNNSTAMTALGGYAFYNCGKLTTIKLSSPLCYIGPFAFYKCAALKSIEIPDGVTAIERETFNGCTALENIKFANTINIIRHHAFYNCTKLKTVVLPDSLTSIERYAFCDCSGITTLVFPKALKNIAYYVFHCKNLKNVYYEGTAAAKEQIKIDYTVHESNGRHNGFLKDATWTFGACIGNTTDFVHTYTDEYDAECDNCFKRTRVTERRPTETEAETTVDPLVTTPADNGSSDASTTTIIIIIVIVVALAVIGCCVFIIINSKKNKPSPETDDKKEEPKEEIKH